MKIKAFIPLFIFLVISCMSEKSANSEFGKSVSQIHPRPIQQVKIPKEHQDTGKIEIHGEDVYLVLNWETRSRITLKVTGSKTAELVKYKDQIIMVTGTKIMENQWIGTIEISEYTPAKK